MTVAELIAKLQKYKPDTKVGLCYDSQVMFVDIKAVQKWKPYYWLCSEDDPKKHETWIGLFDEEEPHAEDDAGMP